MGSVKSERVAREIKHGEWLDANDPLTMWGWSTPAGRLRAKRRARLIQERSGLAPGMRVMEIGCGTGLFTEMFAESGAHILALDVSPNLLKRARERCYLQENVEFVQADFEEYHEVDGFNAVIGSSVLHHLDLESALHNIHRLLRPGGQVCFAEPNYLNPQVCSERIFHNVLPWFDYVSDDETAFFRWKMEKRLYELSFDDVMVRPFDWLHPATPPAFIAGIQKIGYFLENTPILREFAGSLLIHCRK